MQKYSTNMATHFSSASAIASEGLNHIGLVHALGAHSRLESKFRGYLTDARKEGIRKALAAAIQAGLLYFIAFSANALAYWQGSRKIAETVERNDGSASVGEIYTVIFILVDGKKVKMSAQSQTYHLQGPSSSARSRHFCPCLAPQSLLSSGSEKTSITNHPLIAVQHPARSFQISRVLSDSPTSHLPIHPGWTTQYYRTCLSNANLVN